MRKILSINFILALSVSTASDDPIQYLLDELKKPVEILVDHWGVPHIYAQTEKDLFFAQGFYAARDRLFQFEIWRRQATGTISEITGKRDLKRDIGTRLFMFRKDMKKEMNYYHPRGDEIITAFTDGVNAYISYTQANPDKLPIEFKMLGITPQLWTPEVVISRHQGLLGNIGSELRYGRQVNLIGEEKTKALNWFHPWGEPDIKLDSKIDGDHLHEDILELYNAFRTPVRWSRDDILPQYRSPVNTSNEAFDTEFLLSNLDDLEIIGSNNWVIHGTRTASEYPMMANDPHRVQAVPSLRYMAHLVGPGWDVIGGGEPEIPGISIGHNGYGAWGLTVFRTDGEDLYVYETNPSNPNQYLYKNRWVDMKVISDTILVRGKGKKIVNLKYTRHGPVVFEDININVAYAVRSAWMEIGGSPYLASLRMDQAKSWKEFREACNYSHIPGENMIWADRDGNIGWQAVGIAPIRKNWSGLVPVPGDGSYEWSGYLEIKKKPHILNPTNGFFGTANSNLTPQTYSHRNAIGWEWSDPSRWERVNEVLGNNNRFTMQDMVALQTDYLSNPARRLVPMLKDHESDDTLTEKARDLLLDWDYYLDPNSVAAGIYIAWQREIQKGIHNIFVPEEAKALFSSLPMKRIIDWIHSPDGHFGDDPINGRDAFLLQTLRKAVDHLAKTYGTNPDHWVYGQVHYKHVMLRHQLSPVIKSTFAEQLDVGPLSRGGDSFTVNNTGGYNNQYSGASFRILVDTEDWDRTLAMNNPGQSGNPNNPFYKNLFNEWASDGFFPLFYSRDKIESVTAERIKLIPKSND